MKYLIVTAFFLIVTGCGNKKTVQPDYKNATYDTSNPIPVIYFINKKGLQLTPSIAKRVERHYWTTDGFDSTTSPGNYIVKFKQISDSIYILATTDSSMSFVDSTGKIIKDSTGHTQYQVSFRKPLSISKQFIQETTLLTIPQATMDQLTKNQDNPITKSDSSHK